MEFDHNNLDLRLGLSGRVRCETGWRLGSDWSKSLKDYDLWYIWEGKGQIQIDSDQIELHPGVWSLDATRSQIRSQTGHFRASQRHFCPFFGRI